MLRHAIAPVRCFTPASNNVVRHRRLNSDAKILVLHVQGLPEGDADKPLGEHAADLGMKPRVYHRAKESLIACGFLHEWKWQSERGRWNTDQLFSNVTLTRDEANAIRAGGVLAESPSAQNPTVGSAGTRNPASQNQKTKNGEKNSPHPPSPARANANDPDPGREPDPGPAATADPDATPGPAATADPAPNPDPAPSPDPDPSPEPTPDPAPDPQVAAAEGLLLSLRHQHRELLIGVREARALAELAAEWFRRGVSAADLRHALTAHLPRTGVRSAVGFLRHRLTEKLPAPPSPADPSSSASADRIDGGPVPRELISCEGPGKEHVFRPVGDETRCASCRSRAAREAHPHPQPPTATLTRVSWRDYFAHVEEAERSAAQPDPHPA